VDNGFFFPEAENWEQNAWFMMDAMKLLHTDAVNVSEKELRYGRSFLLSNWKRSKLPLVSANLWDKNSKKTLVDPYVLVKKGTVTVGVFGLTSDKVDMGPSRDSLTVSDPVEAAKSTIAALRKKGAHVVVLLSQLGKVESEDLVAAVDGVDVLIIGRNVPVLQKGRMIKNTVACYGGEQGQYIGRTLVTLDPKRRMATGENETFMLGPEVGEKPEMLQLVKSFEDAFNDFLRKKDKEKQVQAEQARLEGGSHEQSVDHFVGDQVCQRCHKAEFEQWKTTLHANAWKTLVDVKKDSNPECIKCHVVGYQQAGGFKTSDDAARLSNVQCENCHGMGTQHEAYPAQSRGITEATCKQCHTKETSPGFEFALFQPHILHTPQANLPKLPVNPNKKKMMMGGS
jgi:hypothetical protein